MTQTEWDKYLDSLVSQVRKNNIVTQADIRKLLSDTGYSKKSREFVKSFSGSDGTKTTFNISVNQTVKRINKKVRDNRGYLSRRIAEIDNGSYKQTLRSLKTLRNNLRQRLRTVSDRVEYRRTKADLDRVVTINKRIRAASAEQLPDVLKSSIKSVNDIQYSKALRSSMNSQVKNVAKTEKTRVKAEKFLDRTGDNVEVDIVLSDRHVIYDICDHAAEAGPYKKRNLPPLPLHGFCECEYQIHTAETEAKNRARRGAKPK